METNIDSSLGDCVGTKIQYMWFGVNLFGHLRQNCIQIDPRNRNKNSAKTNHFATFLRAPEEDYFLLRR